MGTNSGGVARREGAAPAEGHLGGCRVARARSAGALCSIDPFRIRPAVVVLHLAYLLALLSSARLFP
jgi:hypothetical protein